MAARISSFFGSATFPVPKLPKFFLKNQERSGFSKRLFFPSEFRLELGNFILMLFYGHHVSVTRVLHCGQGQVSPGLKLGKGDPVLCTEFFQFVDAHALGFCDEAELAECRSFCRFLTHGDSFTIALPFRGDPRVQCSFWQVHFFGDALYRRASRLLYAFKKRISEGCVGIFSGHKSPLSAPFLGNESGHFDLRKGVKSTKICNTLQNFIKNDPKTSVFEPFPTF